MTGVVRERRDPIGVGTPDGAGAAGIGTAAGSASTVRERDSSWVVSSLRMLAPLTYTHELPMCAARMAHDRAKTLRSQIVRLGQRF